MGTGHCPPPPDPEPVAVPEPAPVAVPEPEPAPVAVPEPEPAPVVPEPVAEVEEEDDGDVPVARSSALIEEALNQAELD